MAEGRSATLLFHLQKRGFNVTGSTPDSEDDGYFIVKLRLPLPWMMAHRLRQGLSTSFFLMRNGLWPASVATVLTVTTGVSLLTVFAETDSWLRSGWLARALLKVDSLVNPFHRYLSLSVRVGYLSAMASLFAVYAIVWAERLLLRIMLSFGPSLFLRSRLRLRQSPGQSFIVFMIGVWAFIIQRLTGRKNLTYAFQLSLPLLPLPPLEHTVQQFIESIEPILNEETLGKVKKLAATFVAKEGRKLQSYLNARRLVVSNYVAPWFERYVYLMARTPLAIDSNYYIMDTMRPSPVKDQVFRAANIVYHLLSFQEILRSEQLDPRMLHDTLPLCMSQYKRLFNTTRIPGREMDALKHNEESEYVIVVRRGRFYKVKTKRDDGFRLNSAEWAHQLRLIMEHANLDAASRGPNCEEKDLMALTTLPRTTWAEVRDRHFGEGINRKSLVTLEKAAFVVHLVSESRLSPGGNSPSNGNSTANSSKFFPKDGDDASTLNRRAHFLFHGDGSDIWFDKSFNLIVFEDGQAGINAEITFGDAPVVAHMWEYALLNELIDFENCRDASALAGESLRGAPLPMPFRLEFSVSDQLSSEIKKAKRDARDAARDIDLDILCFDIFGRDFIKMLGTSPDSFIQMALLLTNYVDAPEKFGLAYESGHTRLFRDGRTETIRSVTKESSAFVKFCSQFIPSKTQPYPSPLVGESMARARELLLEACQAHQALSIKCVSGYGIDRHLFALNVAAKGLEVRSEFLDFATTRLTWTLSSSQQPQVQTKLRSQLPEAIVKDFFCPGGGYAPISDDGYGVAYTMTPSQLFFHVTCKRSSAHTNARRFTSNLRRSLEMIRFILKSSGESRVSQGAE